MPVLSLLFVVHGDIIPAQTHVSGASSTHKIGGDSQQVSVVTVKGFTRIEQSISKALHIKGNISSFVKR